MLVMLGKFFSPARHRVRQRLEVNFMLNHGQEMIRDAVRALAKEALWPPAALGQGALFTA